MTWYKQSMIAILSQKEEVRHLTAKEQEKYCRENYPWQERNGYAYKMWLKAINDAFAQPSLHKPEELEHHQQPENFNLEPNA